MKVTITSRPAKVRAVTCAPGLIAEWRGRQRRAGGRADAGIGRHSGDTAVGVAPAGGLLSETPSIHERAPSTHERGRTVGRRAAQPGTAHASFTAKLIVMPSIRPGMASCATVI